jgi:DNA-binding NarL/FixJ family response regulator
MVASILISVHYPDLICDHKPEGAVMPPNPELPTTAVLFIDGNDADRTYFVEGLRSCSSDYLILEASDGESGLELYRRSRRIDCVVLELDLPDRSGFEVLVNLVPLAIRPNVAVIVLTRLTHRGVWELARQNGAMACFVKRHMGSDALDRAIQNAVAVVGLLPKEDRYQLIESLSRNRQK